MLKESPVNVSENEVRAAVMSFQGEYHQIPPMYSALKVGGKKLYELAREGKEVERKAREVHIHEIEILEMTLPVVKLRVSCSKGTYIRTLCADIGGKLGCGGTMKSLKRTRVGSFSLDKAITLTQLECMRDENRLEEILHSVDSAFAECPKLHVRQEFCRLIDNGNSFYPNQTVEKTTYKLGEWVAVYREDNSFVGVYAFDAGRKWYKPVKMFL